MKALLSCKPETRGVFNYVVKAEGQLKLVLRRKSQTTIFQVVHRTQNGLLAPGDQSSGPPPTLGDCDIEQCGFAGQGPCCEGMEIGIGFDQGFLNSQTS